MGEEAKHVRKMVRGSGGSGFELFACQRGEF